MSGKHVNVMAAKAKKKGIATVRYTAVYALDVEPCEYEEFKEHNRFLNNDPLLPIFSEGANLATFLHSHFTQCARCITSP